MGVKKVIWIVFKAMHRDFRKGINQVRQGLVHTQRQVDNMQNPLKRLGTNIRFQSQQFQMWALGVMFFGMQMMAIFHRLAKVSFDTFNKVMGESINSARESMMGLAASTEMLKFSLGSAIATALEPMIPMILAIVDAISDWVEKHPKLTTALVLGGVALGAFMFFGGQLILFMSSLVQAWFMWGSSILAVLKILPGILAALGTVGLVGWLLLIIAVIAVLVAAWKKNWAGFRDIVMEIVDVIWTTIKIWLDDIVAIFKLVWELIVAVFTGEWGKIPGILKDIFGAIITLVLDVAMGIIRIVVSIVKGAIKLMRNMFIAIGDIVYRGLKTVFGWFARWWGEGGIWGLIKGITQGIVNTVLWMFGQIVGIVQLTIKSFNKLFGTKYEFGVLQKIKDFRVDFGSSPDMSTQSAQPVNITIQGNVIGDESYIKKLGEQIQSEMRRSGNNATTF